MRLRRFLVPLLILCLFLCISSAQAENENSLCITTVDRSAGKVTVVYHVQSPAVLVLEVLEDNRSTLESIQTLRQPVSSESYPFCDEYTFSTGLPEYFQLEARLEGLPSGSGADPFIDIGNTKDIREIMDRTVNDWGSENVLNFDSDITTNYAVLDDGVRVIREDTGLTITCSDDGSGNFALWGTEDRLNRLDLHIGDKLVLVRNSTDGLDIQGVRVTGLSASGGMMDVKADNASMSDIFRQIEFRYNFGDLIKLDKTLSFHDLISASADAAISLDGDLLYTGAVAGCIDLKHLNRNYVRFTMEAGVRDLHIDSRGDYQVSVPVMKMQVPGASIPGLGGLELRLNLPINAVHTGVDCTFNFSFSTSLIFSPEIPNGFEGGFGPNAPSFSLNEAGGELDVGIQGNVALTMLDVFDVSFGAVHYACLDAKISGGELSGGKNNNDKWHSCVIEQNGVQLPACINGTLGYMYSWKGDATIAGIFSKGFQLDLITAFRHAFPWYWSLLYSDHQFNKECPHYGVRLDVNVVNSDGFPLSDASVRCTPVPLYFDKKCTGSTGRDGKVALYVEGDGASDGNRKLYEVTAEWKDPEFGTLSGSAQVLVGPDPASVTVVIPTRPYIMHFIDEFGGEPAKNMPEDERVGPNQINYTVPSQVPTKTAYDFVSWIRMKDWRSAGQIQPGETVPIFRDEETNIFYALWERKKYSVEYDANGGTSAPLSQIKYPTESLQLSSEQPERSGFTFLGWAVDPEAEIPEYFPGQIYDTDANLKLYAVWQTVPVIPCRITFDANADGDSSAIAPSPQYVLPGATFLLSQEEPVRSGPFAFLGWNTDPDPEDGMPSILPGQEYQVTEDLTLFAIWQLMPTTAFKVTYDANVPGDSSATAPPAQYALPGTTIILRDDVAYRDGPFIFLGWNPDPDPEDGMPVLLPEQEYTVTDNVTLYAIWQTVPVTAFRITYDANADPGSKVIVPAMQYASAGTAVRLSTDVPVWDELHLFLGWSPEQEPAGGMPSVFPGQDYTVTGDVTLYAVWRFTPALPYRITYNANAGGYPNAVAPLPQYAARGATIRLYPAGATWDDMHAFLGWNPDPEPDDGMPTLLPGQEYTVTESVTLYAIWMARPVLTYEVTYDPTPGTGCPEKQIQSEKRTLTLSSLVPVYEGHILSGWRSSQDGGLWLPGSCYTKRVSTLMTAEWKADYHIIDGNGNVYQMDSGENLIFRANGPLELFDCLMIDGETLPADGYYTARSGSTICELFGKFLNTLKAGEHTICFIYKDGRTETGHFSVQAKKPFPPTGDPGVPLLPALLSVLMIVILWPRGKKNGMNH